MTRRWTVRHLRRRLSLGCIFVLLLRLGCEIVSSGRWLLQTCFHSRTPCHSGGHFCNTPSVGSRRSSSNSLVRRFSTADLQSLTVVELKKRLKQDGLTVSGKKAELIERLFGHSDLNDSKNPKAAVVEDIVIVEEQAANQQTEVAREDLKGLTVAQLKEQLRQRGLPLSGKKAELIQRLQQTEADAESGPVPGGIIFDIGDKVRAEGDDGEWYSATIEKRIAAEKFLVKFEDSKLKHECTATKMRKLKPDGFPVHSLAVGQKLVGDVADMQSYGLFVDVGADRDGLVPLSKLDGTPELGDEVEVWVSRINKDGTLELTMVEGRIAPQRMVRDPGRPPLGSLEVGQEVTGIVQNVVEYGAFIDVGVERDGLLPLAKMSEEGETESTVKPGQEVTVWISKVRPTSGIELSMVQSKVDAASAERHMGIPLSDITPGQKFTGFVRKAFPYGVFVDIGAEKDGLVPKNRMPDPDQVEEFEAGDEVDVWVSAVKGFDLELAMSKDKIKTVDERERRLREMIGQKVTGTVMNVVDYGIFVDVGGLRAGLVPLSRIAEKNVSDPYGIVEEGQEVDVWISKIKTSGDIELAMVESKCGKDQDISMFETMDRRTWMDGVVMAINEHGAFITVTPPDGGGKTFDGLALESQVTPDVKVGEQVQVRVHHTEADKKRVFWSMIDY